MNLEVDVKKFLQSPFPLWETELTNKLAANKWNELYGKGLKDKDSYTTSKVWLNDFRLKAEQKIVVAQNTNNRIYLETPTACLESFYQEHRLELLDLKEINQNSAIDKIQNALQILKQIDSVYECIVTLVKAIHILKNDDEEVDLSYSHPKIPFSIFLSVCEDESTISKLRLAESILHEAMHLKLTLIEEIVPLVKDNAANTLYSPWKNEERPVQGVLHGLFVFRAISELYRCIVKNFQETDVQIFVNTRIEEVYLEISSLFHFYENNALSDTGKMVVLSLNQY